MTPGGCPFKNQGGGMTVKTLQIIAAIIMTCILYGCSEQSNPVGPAGSSGLAGAKGNDILPWSIAHKPAERDGASDTNIVAAWQSINADVGGSVRLQGAFLDKHGDSVSYDLSIMFAPGALPYDAMIGISIDKTTFQQDGTVSFGPHGIVFNIPGTLSLSATNIDFVKKNKTVNLYYDDSGVMQLMPNGWGSVTKIKSDISVLAGARIPHFSAYAFGR